MKWCELPDGEDYLLKPVKAGMCRYESLKDGTLDLADIALMHDYLSVDADNDLIARNIAEQIRERK